MAEIIQTSSPAPLVALTEDASNARTEGFNRIIKQIKLLGCGDRNVINYERRILSHIAVTRPQKSAALGCPSKKQFCVYWIALALFGQCREKGCLSTKFGDTVNKSDGIAVLHKVDK